MTAPFRYPDEDWRPIEVCLLAAPRTPASTANAHVQEYYNQSDTARRTIEGFVHRYVWMTARTDPRAPEIIAAKPHWQKLPVHLQGALAALDGLEAIETKPVRTLGYAIAVNPLTSHADYLTWKNQNAEATRWAAKAAKGLLPKSARGSNRSRGDDVDQLFADLLTFWIARGGRVGKGAKSPSTRFVTAAAGRILSDHVPVKLPRAIVDFVRSRHDEAQRI